MKISIKTLLPVMTSLGLAACGGSGSGGGFGETQAPAPRTHVCPTTVAALSDAFFTPYTRTQYASGAAFTQDMGVQGYASFVDAEDVIGIAIAPHKLDQTTAVYLPDTLESEDGSVDDVRYKQYLVAQFHANDFDTNTLDVRNLAYVYLAEKQDGSPSVDHLPELLPMTNFFGQNERRENQTVVAYANGQPFRYRTQMVDEQGPLISGKRYLKQVLFRLVHEGGATTDSVREGMDAALQQPAVNGAGRLGFSDASNLMDGIDSLSRKSSGCAETAYESFINEYRGDSFGNVKNELSELNRALQSSSFDITSRSKIQKAAYEMLCPEENRFSHFLDEEIQSLDWSTASTSGEAEDGKCVLIPGNDLFYGAGPTGISIRHDIVDYISSNVRSLWDTTTWNMELIWTKIYFDRGCGGNSRTTDAPHHARWYRAIMDGNESEMIALFNADISLYPSIRELVWHPNADNGSGYLKGCFNGTKDWPETSIFEFDANYTLRTFHQDVLNFAEGIGGDCASRDATLATMQEDVVNLIDSWPTDPQNVIRAPSSKVPEEHFINGVNELHKADYVLPFINALRCEQTNAKTFGDPDACPVKRADAMADLQRLVDGLGSSSATSSESRSLSLVPLHSESTVADVLETAYRSADTFISSVNAGELNLSKRATGTPIGDACMAHLVPLIDWKGAQSDTPITQLNLQHSGLSKEAFLALVRSIYNAKISADEPLTLKVIDATHLGISIDAEGDVRFKDDSGLSSEDKLLFDDLFGYARDEKLVLLLDGGQLIGPLESIEVELPEPQ